MEIVTDMVKHCFNVDVCLLGFLDWVSNERLKQCIPNVHLQLRENALKSGNYRLK